MSIRIIRTNDGRYWDVANDADIFATPTVQACPVGGGFVRTIPSADVALASEGITPTRAPYEVTR